MSQIPPTNAINLATDEIDKQKLEFLKADYGNKINYLTNHFTRVWQRFNFFITLESALSAAIWLWVKDKGWQKETASLAVIGAVTSFCWYVFGAQDRYLIAVYRQHLKDCGEQLAELLGIKPYTSVGDPEATVKMDLTQWRADKFSTTRLAAWFPLVALLYWLVMIGLIVKFSKEIR